MSHARSDSPTRLMTPTHSSSSLSPTSPLSSRATTSPPPSPLISDPTVTSKLQPRFVEFRALCTAAEAVQRWHNGCGYPRDRFSNVTAEVICNDCQQILRDPVKLPCPNTECHNITFCRACVNKYIDKLLINKLPLVCLSCKTALPTSFDKDKLDTKFPLLQAVLNMTITCPWGCNATFQFGDTENNVPLIITHAESCLTLKIHCLLCEEDIQRGAKDHHSRTCPQMTEVCDLCSECYVIADAKKHRANDANCVNCEVCKFGCCSSSGAAVRGRVCTKAGCNGQCRTTGEDAHVKAVILKNEATMHYEVCSRRTRLCEFGCGDGVASDDFAEHKLRCPFRLVPCPVCRTQQTWKAVTSGEHRTDKDGLCPFVVYCRCYHRVDTTAEIGNTCIIGTEKFIPGPSLIIEGIPTEHPDFDADPTLHKTIRLQNDARHKELCPMETIECDICHAQMERHCAIRHNKDAVELHITHIKANCDVKDAIIQTLTDKLSTSEVRVNVLQRSVEHFSSLVTAMRDDITALQKAMDLSIKHGSVDSSIGSISPLQTPCGNSRPQTPLSSLQTPSIAGKQWHEQDRFNTYVASIITNIKQVIPCRSYKTEKVPRTGDLKMTFETFDANRESLGTSTICFPCNFPAEHAQFIHARGQIHIESTAGTSPAEFAQCVVSVYKQLFPN